MRKPIVKKVFAKSESSETGSSSGSESESVKEFRDTLTREILEEIAGMELGDNLDLYKRALVHKSLKKDFRGTTGLPDYAKQSNERLEFVGDSILGGVVSDWLYQKYPDKDEGFLTSCKTRIVQSKTLSYFADKLGIRGRILMGKHMTESRGEDNNRLLEDAFEAFVGALYYDKGFESCKTFIIKVIETYFEEDLILKDTNYKDIVLRYAQYIKTELPKFNVVKEITTETEKEFIVEVVIFGQRQGKGRGKRIKDAEQEASKDAIQRINIPMKF